MSIAGNDALISYDRQHPTCNRYNETGCQQQDCPRRKRVGPPSTIQSNSTWADIVSRRAQDTKFDIFQTGDSGNARHLVGGV